jgi:hypothetical protein
MLPVNAVNPVVSVQFSGNLKHHFYSNETLVEVPGVAAFVVVARQEEKRRKKCYESLAF